MDDAFEFRARRMPRRRLDPLALKAATIAAVLIATVGVFAKVAIDSERRSLEATRAPEVRVSTIEGAAAIGATTIAADPALDEPAREAARQALAAARDVLRADGTLDGATPLRLSSLSPSLIFVDGRSAVSEVVSVSSTASSWAAAVMGDSGACYYVRVTTHRRVRYGTGSTCTGVAALGAADRAWPPIPATP